MEYNHVINVDFGTHQDPHVVLQAIVLLDACINNCGQYFLMEVNITHDKDVKIVPVNCILYLGHQMN